MRFVITLLMVIGLAFTGCDDSPPEQTDSGGNTMYGGKPTGGGSGQVSMGTSGTREGGGRRYERAIKRIKNEEFDEARELLLEELHRGSGANTADIQTQLRVTERGILRKPAKSVTGVFDNASKLFRKRVSIRGTFLEGGPVGKSSYYFWVQSGEKIQCRYQKLTLDDKQKILLIEDGQPVLVRGRLMEPWGTNKAPYLELSYFRIEKRRKPAAAKEE